MSFEVSFYKKVAIATFKHEVIKNEITKAFIEITETVSIKNLKYLVFDLSDIILYEMPADYKKRVKLVTHFSASWNSKIDVIFIATNKDVRFMAEAFINHEDDLKWGYHLFDTLKSAKVTFKEI